MSRNDPRPRLVPVNKFESRFYVIMIDKRNGENFMGIPPQEIRVNLQVVGKDAQNLSQILANQARAQFWDMYEDFKSKHSELAFESDEFLFPMIVPVATGHAGIV